MAVTRLLDSSALMSSLSDNKKMDDTKAIAATSSSSSFVSLTAASASMAQGSSLCFQPKKAEERRVRTLVDHLLLAMTQGVGSLPDFKGQPKLPLFKEKLGELVISMEQRNDGRWFFLRKNETIESVSQNTLRKNMQAAFNVALDCYPGKYTFHYFNTTPKQITLKNKIWYEIRLSSETKIEFGGRTFERHIEKQYENAREILDACKEHMRIVCHDEKSAELNLCKLNQKVSYRNVVSLVFDSKEFAEAWCIAHGGVPLPELPEVASAATAATSTREDIMAFHLRYPGSQAHVSNGAAAAGSDN